MTCPHFGLVAEVCTSADDPDLSDLVNIFECRAGEMRNWIGGWLAGGKKISLYTTTYLLEVVLYRPNTYWFLLVELT
jgi:hypothetical protein